MRVHALSILASALALVASAAVAQSDPAAKGATTDAAKTAPSPSPSSQYVARLEPLNARLSGRMAGGEARFVIEQGTLTISVDARGTAPGIMHLQHLHGFADGRSASCATADADGNGDGIVDLIETEAVSGTTMVPFTANPADLKIVADTYPKASDNGSYSWRHSVPLDKLRQAFAGKFGGHDLMLERRVVYIHGVAPTTSLPESVASLGTVPAQVTLPIACGRIELAN